MSTDDPPANGPHGFSGPGAVKRSFSVNSADIMPQV